MEEINEPKEEIIQGYKIIKSIGKNINIDLKVRVNLQQYTRQ